MNHDEIISKVNDAGVSLVRFLYCDNGGIIRGKAARASSLSSSMESGIGLTVAMQAMNALDQLQPVEGFGPVGEIRLVPDPATFRVLPYATGNASMLVDMLTPGGQPWGACPRGFLKRMMARGSRHGIRFQVAFEPEWSLAVRDGDDFRPLDESLCFSTVGMTQGAAVINDVINALEAQQMPVEQYYPELGHGQHELSIAHAHALLAADNHVRYRETVRSVAWNHGLYASFAPKPWPNQAGNGCHIHVSAWDESGSQNLFYDPHDRYRLSSTGYHFISGVLDHLPALVALTCPSFNSYQRLQPGSWSSAFVCYGPDNREAAVRICSPYRRDEASTLNLEIKTCDSSCNPYLALGGVLAAGLNGLERKADPGQGRLVSVDPATISSSELEQRGIRRLPQTLAAALDELERDPVMMNALGDLLGRSFIAVRRSEWAAFSTQNQDFEMKHHFYKY